MKKQIHYETVRFLLTVFSFFISIIAECYPASIQFSNEH